MADFYTGLAATATQLLTDKGQSLVFTRVVPLGFNPVTGVKILPTTTTYTSIGAGFNYKKSEVDGGVIQRGDVRLVLHASEVEPLIDDKVTYNGFEYRIMNVEEISPGGIVVIYKAQIRK